MRNLLPAASACFVVAFIASVGYAESKIEVIATITSETKDSGIDESVAVAEASADQSANVSESDQDLATTNGLRELSAAPLSHITYPEDRPTWVDQVPDFDSGIHTLVVTTGGCESMAKCEDQLDALVPGAVAHYIKRTTGWECDEEFLDADWIDDSLILRRYVGTLQKGDQTLHEVAVELHFDAENRERIREASQNSMVNERLCATGALFAFGLFGLCCSGGILGIVSRRFA